MHVGISLKFISDKVDVFFFEFQGLYMCEDPPGYEDLDILKEKYPLIDTSYEPIMPWKLPREGYGDEACTPRVQQTLEGIEKRFPGNHFAKMEV